MRLIRWTALCAYVLMVISTSLYPWRMGPYRSNLWSWAPLVTRGDAMDAILNLWFYAPLGLLAYLATRRIWFGAALGAVVSFGVEYTQQWIVSRNGNLHDLAMNTLGSALGGGLAWFGSREAVEARLLAVARSPMWRLHREGALLLALWFCAQLFPFAPGIRMSKVYEGMRQLREFSGTWPQAVATAVGFAALVVAVRRPAWLTLAFLALPVQGLILDRSLFPLHIVAGAVGWAVGWTLIRSGLERFTGAALLVYLVADQFRPLRFAVFMPIAGVPFAAFVDVFARQYFVTLVGKLYLFTAALALRRWDLQRTTFGLAIAICIGELAQQWLAGRTPETTDPGLVVIAGFLLWWIGTTSRGAENPAGRG